MWRVLNVGTVLTLLGLAYVFVLSPGYTIETNNQALTGSISQSQQLSMVSPTPLMAETVEIATNEAYLNARFTGMLSHVRWLMEQNQGGYLGDNEITRIDKQFESLADDVLEDLKDIRRDIDDIDVSASLTVDENIALGSFYLSGDGDDEGILVNVSGDVQLTAALLDAGGNAGDAGYVLQSTGTTTNWVATSTLGIAGTLSNNAVLPDYVQATGQTDEYCLTYEATGSTWEWQSCGNASTTPWTESGSDIYFTGGNVGIGELSPNTTLYVTATSTGVLANNNLVENYFIADPAISGARIFDAQSNTVGIPSTNSNNLTGFGTIRAAFNYAFHNGLGTVANAVGTYSQVDNFNAGNITSMRGNEIYLSNGGAGDVANSYGIYMYGPDNWGGGTWQNAYGLYIADHSGVVSQSDFNIYSAGANSTNYFAGNVGIGTSTPSASLVVDGDVQITGTTTLQNNNQIAWGDGTVALYGNASGYKNFEFNIDSNAVFTIDDTTIYSDVDLQMNGGELVFSNGPAIFAPSVNNLVLETNSLERLRINATGDISIGTSTPIGKVMVEDSATDTSGGVRGLVSDLYTNPSGASTAFTIANSARNFVPSGASATFGTIYGQYGDAKNLSSQSGSLVVGTEGYAQNEGGTLSVGMYGLSGDAEQNGGTVAWLTGLKSWSGIYGGAATNQAGLYVSGLDNSGGTVTNRYGLYIESPAGAASNDFGIYQAGAQNNYFAGNVGIGTTTPEAQLSIQRSSNADMSIRSVANGSADIDLYGYRLNDNNPLVQITGYNLGSDDVARISYYRDGNDDAGAIRFYTQQNGSSIAEKMRLTSYGELGIGTTTPAQALQVFGDIRVGTVGSNGCLEDYGGGLISGTCSSDERLKTDILSVRHDDTESFAERLSQLDVVTYKWNETAGLLYSKDTDIENLGLIAQDVESVFPELISEDEEGFKQVDFRAFPFYLIEAIKELWNDVTNNTDRIDELEEENERLKDRLEAIEKELDVEVPEPTPEPEVEAEEESVEEGETVESEDETETTEESVSPESTLEPEVETEAETEDSAPAEESENVIEETPEEPTE